MDSELWGHQIEGVQRALASGGSFGFFFEAGAGKSRTVIEVLRHIYTKHGGILKTFILAPQVVCPNWRAEFAKFSKVPEKEIELIAGSGKQRCEQVKTTTARILITNYQTLLMEDVFEELRTWGPVVIIADESHRIKNYKAMTTKRALVLADAATYKYILSGTPILQSAKDAFPQFLFLDGGKTFGRNFFTFQRQYFVDQNAALRRMNAKVKWPNWVPKKSKETELINKIASKTSSVLKKDCMDLPPYVRQRITVGLSKEQFKAYEEMRKYMITYIQQDACTAQMALHKALRLQQIVSGFVGNDEGNEHNFKNVPRLDALQELLEDLCPTNKVIVWACWRNNQKAIRRILDTLKIGYREILGDTGPSEREEAMDDFRNLDEVRVILGSQAAGGIGINLVEASHAIYYSRSFSLEHDVQSEARNYRGGSELHAKITRLDLVAPGTIDETVLEALSKKQNISDRIIFQCLKN